MSLVSTRSLAHRLSLARSTILLASSPTRRRIGTLLVAGANIELLPDGVNAPRRFTIKVTETVVHRSKIASLLKRRVGRHGNALEHLPTDPAVQRFTLAATHQGETIGSITVTFDCPDGLVADRGFAPEVNALRAQGRRICEFIHLVVDPTVGTKRLLGALFHVAYIIAHRVRGNDLLLVQVNPRHADYYVRMLGFQVLGSERMHPLVKAPAVLLGLDFAYVLKQIGELGGQPARIASEHTLYPAAFSPSEEAAIIARLSAWQSVHEDRQQGHTGDTQISEFMLSGTLAVG